MRRTKMCPRCGPQTSLGNHVRYAGCGVTDEELFWVKVDADGPGGCWVWKGAKKHDHYGLLNRHDRMTLAHRYSWELANGPVPTGMWVLHRCDNPPCVNPAHLFLGDREANTADMMAKGRHGGRGEKNRTAKLTESAVRQIRAEYRPERSGKRIISSNVHELMAKYPGVGHQAITNAALGRTWKHVK